MPSKKRRRAEQSTTHPRNRYSENPPDFRLLASLYPSFEPFVFYSRDGHPRIDWTDFNATRELTRVLLDHDHGVKWWIPDGQLCPTVPNRSNYIHWIEDLLASEVIAKANTRGDKVRGFDIGTGANCIYPLLGASLMGWSFVGSDVTDVALEWAERNVKSNPHLSELIEIRNAGNAEKTFVCKETVGDQFSCTEAKQHSEEDIVSEAKSESLTSNSVDVNPDSNNEFQKPLVLVGVVKDGENFDFCMCNPPFFESMDEAGLNPKTACGGTPAEMVCAGGEKAFITNIIEDSVVLQQTFRWYTSMIGRKTNLKFLISKLREAGVSIVKTTEFVQGQTCRWGLAWSFVPPARKIISSHVTEKSNLSFMLEGLPRQLSAILVLKYLESYFLACGASCKSNSSTYVVDVIVSGEQCNILLNDGTGALNETITSQPLLQTSSSSTPVNQLCFRVSVFQQIPGTLLVKGSLQHKGSPLSGAFSLMFQGLEEALKKEFCRHK